VFKKPQKIREKKYVEEVRRIAVMNKIKTLLSTRLSLRQFTKSTQVFSKLKTCHFSKDESGSASFLNP